MRGTDEESFREFIGAQWGPMTRLAFLLVGDRGHAEDVVQTVLMKLWTKWPSVREEAPEAYARRALTNTAISWRRRRWHGEQPTGSLPDVAGSVDFTRSVAERAALAHALGGLPARQRAAVVLRFAEDMSEVQVAEALNCSVGNVKSLVSRGLARLREAEAGAPVREDPLPNGLAG